MDDLNPYRSPGTTPESTLSTCQVKCDPTQPLHVELITSGALVRRIQLSGRLEADIEWNANGFREFVAVNGEKVVAEHAIAHSIPRFEFQIIAGASTHVVTVENQTKWVFVTTAFRVSIDGQAIYSEGNWSKSDSP